MTKLTENYEFLGNVLDESTIKGRDDSLFSNKNVLNLFLFSIKKAKTNPRDC